MMNQNLGQLHFWLTFIPVLLHFNALPTTRVGGNFTALLRRR